jgi:hydrogenase maturation protease
MTPKQSGPRALVIGIGNALRGDDAVGLIVARRVQEAGLDGVTVRQECGEGTALMETWQGADTVILVDAVHSGAASGAIRRLDANAQPVPARFFHHSTHAVGLAEAIELARALNRLPPRLVVFGIEGKTFAAGAPLSPEVEAAAGQVVDRVLEEIQQNVGTKAERV